MREHNTEDHDNNNIKNIIIIYILQVQREELKVQICHYFRSLGAKLSCFLDLWVLQYNCKKLLFWLEAPNHFISLPPKLPISMAQALGQYWPPNLSISKLPHRFLYQTGWKHYN